MSITETGTVYIVDDDPSVRRALGRLVRTAGYGAKEYASAELFLQSSLAAREACLVADIRMPGMGGLALQRELAARRIPIPVIFVTAHDTEETRSQAKGAGAVAYFRKPVDDQALLDAIGWALSRKAAGPPGEAAAADEQ